MVQRFSVTLFQLPFLDLEKQPLSKKARYRAVDKKVVAREFLWRHPANTSNVCRLHIQWEKSIAAWRTFCIEEKSKEPVHAIYRRCLSKKDWEKERLEKKRGFKTEICWR